jgi:hypothetical protein
MFVRACLALILLSFGTTSASAIDDQVSTYIAGTTGAKDIAFDLSGNMYVTGQGGGQGLVYKIGPGGAPLTTFATGLLDPWGLTFDDTGKLYVADRGNPSVANSGVIYSVTPGGVKTVFKSSLQSPTFLAFGPGGDLYFSNWGGLKVQKITPGGVVSEYGSGLTVPGEEIGGICFDNIGNLYVGAGTKLKLVAPGGAPVTTIASGLGSMVGLDRRGDGTIFFARYSFKDIVKVTPAGATETFITAGTCVNPDATPVLRADARSNVTGTARLHDGRLFYSDSACNRIRVVDFASPATKDTWGRVKAIYRR